MLNDTVELDISLSSEVLSRSWCFSSFYLPRKLDNWNVEILFSIMHLDIPLYSDFSVISLPIIPRFHESNCAVSLGEIDLLSYPAFMKMAVRCGLHESELSGYFRLDGAYKSGPDLQVIPKKLCCRISQVIQIGRSDSPSTIKRSHRLSSRCTSWKNSIFGHAMTKSMISCSVRIPLDVTIVSSNLPSTTSSWVWRPHAQ